MQTAKPFRDYTAEEVLQLASICTWPSRKYLQQEFENHYQDWLKNARVALTFTQYSQLARILLASQGGGIFYYRYEGVREQFAIIQDIKILQKEFKRVGLVIDPERRWLIGLWKIGAGERYFESRPDSRRIR